MGKLAQTAPALTVEQLEEQLGLGPVSFGFVKKSKMGFRKALGTTHLPSIPADKHPKGIRKPSEKSVVFYDCEIGKWRSVSKSSLVFEGV